MKDATERHPQVRLLLDLSTAHVSESTASIMDHWSGLACIPTGAIVYSKGEYGWLVYVPSELPERTDRPDIPDDIWACMVFAHSHGCDWIMFDRDGVTVEELKAYDW